MYHSVTPKTVILRANIEKHICTYAKSLAPLPVSHRGKQVIVKHEIYWLTDMLMNTDAHTDSPPPY